MRSDMNHHEHHAGHGDGDHSPATNQLSPNEHRKHAQPEVHTGHGEHTGHSGPGGHGGHGDHAAQFRDRFWLCLVLTVPVVAYSGMVQEWLGFPPPPVPGAGGGAPLGGGGGVLFGG